MKRILMIRVWAIAISAFLVITSVAVIVKADGTAYTVTSVASIDDSYLGQTYTIGTESQLQFPSTIHIVETHQINNPDYVEGTETPEFISTSGELDVAVSWSTTVVDITAVTDPETYTFSPTITDTTNTYDLATNSITLPTIAVSVVAQSTPAHETHTYEVEFVEGADSLTVSCSCDTNTCPYYNQSVTVSLVATGGEYTGSPFTASCTGDLSALDLTPSIAISYYVQDDETPIEAPTEEGNYTAKAVVTVVGETKTLVKNFAITAAPEPFVELTVAPVIALPEGHTVPIIDDVLTTSATGTNVYYQWYVGTTLVDNNITNTYTVVEGDYGQTITVHAVQDANTGGVGFPSEKKELSSTATAAVIKKTITPPAAPTKATQTYNGFTINTIVGQQYAITTANSAPETGWETATTTTKTYTDLSVGTYYVFTKIPETTSTQEAVSSALEVTIAADTYIELTEIPAITISNSHTAPQIGDILSTSSSATGVTYQWCADGVAINEATSNTYTVVVADYGKVITVVVTQPANVSYSRPAEAITKTSAATTAVIKVPVATPAAPTVTAQTYNSFTISTENGQYYAMSTTASVPTEGWVLGDGNSKIYSDLSAGTYYVYTMVQETETSQGAVSSAKSVTIAVDNFVELTAKPVISNTSPKVGDTLTTSSSATSVTYQWYADAEVISGATSVSYTVAEVDLGKVITVVVTQPEDVSYGRPASQITKQSDPTAAVATASSSSGGSGSGSSSSGSSSSGSSSSGSSSSSSSPSSSSSASTSTSASTVVTPAVITPQQEDAAAQAKQEPVVEKVEEVKETLDKPEKDEPKEEVEEESEEEAEKEPVTEETVSIGEGTVSVKIDSESSTNLSAKLVNVRAIINSVLTEEQLAAVEAGAKVEIKVEMTSVSADDISSQDKMAIKAGMEAYKNEHPQMAMANYIDISMFLKIEDGDWNAVRQTSQPVEILIDIPKDYLGLSDTYYIMRVHDGEYTLLYDLDDDPNTITISTGMFSTYALMYDKALAAAEEENEEFAVPVNWGIMMAVMLGLAFLGELLFFLNVKRHPKPQRKTSF